MSKTDRYLTILPIGDGEEFEVERLFDAIQARDPTWTWKMQIVDGRFKAVVYSRSKNQAKQRGEWLTRNTKLFTEYETTHSLTLKTALKEKPREVESVRNRLKRDKVWKEASQTNGENRI